MGEGMSDGTNEQPNGAAGGEGVGDQGNAASKGAQKTGSQESNEEGVTLLEDDEEIVVGDDDDEDEEDGGDETEGEGKRPKPSRSKRYQEQIRRLKAENDELRGARARRPSAAADDEDSDLKEPKESDYPNDYLAYDRALRKFETQKAIREENRRQSRARADEDAAEEHRQRLTGYNSRLAEIKPRIADFDEVMKGARGTEIRDDIRDQILESSKGPLLAYYLSKHPDVLDDLNRMNATNAARKLGQLEARIRGPKPKTATKAKAPAKTPAGGAAPAGKDPAKMTSDEYYTWRQGGGGK